MSKANAAESVEAIGERLRLTRLALGLNQADWCRRTEIATNAWNNYERGRGRISIDAAFKVVQAAGVGLDWIYRGEESLLSKNMFDKIAEVRKREEAEKQAEADRETA